MLVRHDVVPGLMDEMQSMAIFADSPERLAAAGGRGVEDGELDRPAGKAFHLVDVEAFLQPAAQERGDAGTVRPHLPHLRLVDRRGIHRGGEE